MSMVPPPGAGGPPMAEFGPSAGGPNAPPNGAGPGPMPSPPQPPLPKTQVLVDSLMQIKSAVMNIAMADAASVPECNQIKDLVDSIQMKILNAQPPSEPGAPPV